MPGPSKDVQGGYLGYSALTESYNKALEGFRGARTERLEQEKLELQNEAAVDDMFSLPQYQQSNAGGSKGAPRPKTTVVTNGGFSFTANPEDALQKNMLTPDLGLDKTPEEMMYDQYRQGVAGNQRDVFKGKEFSLDGNALPGGGTFNSTLQGALEGLKGEYVREGRRTSPRRKREGRSRVRQQLQALQGFAGEIQGAQQAYREAYDNDLISFGTQSEYIDLLNTLQVPNDLQIQYQDGRGFLVGNSMGGKPISLPLDNIETLKNGLVLKGNNPQPLIDELIKETNKVTEGVDEHGVKTENNAWTIDKTNRVEQQLGQLIKSDNDVLSMGVDWLGYDPVKFKSLVKENPQEARQNVLDAMAYHVRAQHQAIDKGGLTAAQAGTQQNQKARLQETIRHNAITENQAQQKIDKPSTTDTTKGDTVSDIASNLTNPNFWGNKKIEGGEIINSSKDNDILTLQFKTGSSKGSPVGSTRTYNLQDDNDVEKLIYDTYGDKASGIVRGLKDQGLLTAPKSGGGIGNVLGTPAPNSNEIKSKTGGSKKTPAQLAAEYRARKQK